MSFWDMLYVLAMFLFAFMTFVIVRNYFRLKFDSQGRRKDMLDEYENQEPENIDEKEEKKD
jgi:flagellar biosynthesis/type III secretory pathway M-ring protein FliF/YscJ